MKKRILSMLLAIVMVVGLIPDLRLVANAAEDTTDLSVFHGTRTDFRDESVYTLLISRFYDGDSGNNVHCWDDGTAGNPDSDPAWRGDFKGLIEKLDYIKALGFTAVRLNPVVQNASGYDYHGFHPINLMDIDFRLESDGYTYEDLIDACHARGLKVIQYVDLNNTSNFGEENLRKLFDLDEEANWSSITESLIPTETLLEQYPDYAELNPGAQYQARLDMLKNSLNSDGYYHTETSSAWSDSYVMQQGQIAGDCVDLNTEHHEVALYLAECCAWYAKMGVDAVSFNVARHINRWTFNEGILPLLNGLLEDAGLELDIFYDVEARSRNVWYNNNPSLSVPFYSWAETEEAWQDNWNPDHPTANIQTSIDHYNAHDTLEEYDALTSNNALLDGITYHTPDYSQSSGMHAFDFTMMWNFENAGSAFQAGAAEDRYINDSTWNLLSVDSWDYGPDGMEKTRYSNGVDAWKQNLNLMFTFRGIPSIYYGSEIEFAKGMPIDVGPNAPLANTGRAYYGDHLEGTVTATGFGEYEAAGKVADTLNSELSKHIRMLNELRQKIPALRKGQYTKDGNYVNGNIAFIRRYTDANAGIDSLALVTLSGGATFKNIPNGKYVDAVSGNEINVTNGTLTVPSPGSGGLAVYVCCADGFTGLDAELSPAESVLRFNVDGDTTAVHAVDTVNGKAQLPAAPELPDGYTFLSWIVNGVEYEPGDTVAISVDSMARANLKKPVAANIASVTVGGDTTNYTDIASAILAAQGTPDSMLTLLDNITAGTHVTIDSGSFTIDLNGKTWQCSGYLMYVRGEADITIIDNSTEGTGKLLGTGNAYTIMLYGSANLEIAGGTVENNSMAAAIAMDATGNPSESTLTVSGGKVVATDGSAISAFGKSVTVTGGNIESRQEWDIYYKTGTIDLSGHSDPTGIRIYNDTDAAVTPGEDTIKLPDGYVMLDSTGNVAANLAVNQTYTVGVAPVTQSVSIAAVDAADDRVLAGAHLQILKDNDVIVIDGKKMEWDSTTDPKEITGLKTNVEYTLRATVAPDGYTVPTDTQFSIDEKGKVTYTGSITEDGVLLVEFDITVVQFSAVDGASGEAIEGAHMQILDKDGHLVEERVSAVDDEETVDVDESICTVTGLKTNVTYILRAAMAPAGYTIAKDVTFSIDAVGNVSSTGTVSADGILLVEFEQTAVKVSAVESGAGEAIEGAHLQILDADGNLVDEWISAVDDEATEDVDESIHEITRLKTGVVYTLHAVTAPAGYAIADDTTFVIRADGTLSTTGSLTEDGILLHIFEETEVRIVAFDSAAGEGIAGATMQILDAAGNVVEEWVSAADVEATEDVDESIKTITGLNTGETFTLHTTVAPDGYTVPADTTFSIDENGKITTTGSLTEDGILLAEFESAVTTYPLYVGMQQFTENLLTITDGSGGTATYDPDTNTLTLNNYTYEGTGKGYVNDRAAIFYHGEETLTLHLVGKSSITYSGNTSGNNYGFYAYQADVIFSGTGDLTSSGGEAEWFSGGIFVYHDLTLSGTGKLNVIGENGGGSSQGIYCAGALTISDGTVNITTGEAQDSIGIRGTYGAISVDGGSLNITCGNASNINCGIYTVYGGFVCSDGTVTVTSGNAPNNSYGIYADESDFVLSGGTVTVTGGICGTDEGGYSCGIVAQNISVHDGHLTAVGSTAATSVGIYAFETAALYGGVLEAAGQTQALNMAPAVDSGFANAAVWYGDNAAAAGEAKPIGDLANNYSQKYVKVAASEPDTYTVTVRESENGTVTADKTTAAEGETVTITVDPDPGKRVDKVVVKDKNGDPVEVTENPDGTYSYEQPNGNVTIEATFGNIPVYSDPVYRPTIENTTGGDVTVSDRYPEKGDKVTITTDPNKGYDVGEVTVTDIKGKPVEVTDNGDGTYTYIQPTGKVTIKATFQPETCLSEEFVDLDPDAWYHAAVDYVLRKGLMNGVGNGKFDPNGTTSRAMIVTILWRLEGEPVVNYLMQFEDVPAETWYTEAVRWAASERIVEGYSDTAFGPADPITREQFAAILWRYAKYKSRDVSVGENTNILRYEDAFSISEYAIPAMQWACGAGLLQGDGVNLTPRADATRAQAAALFQRFCENVAEK